MDVGTELREARQRAGLSREQIAQRTHSELAKIEALEENRLPAGLYLDRIVRAYAYEVGLDDPDRLLREVRAASHVAAISPVHRERSHDPAPAEGDAFDLFPAESTLISSARTPLSSATIPRVSAAPSTAGQVATSTLISGAPDIPLSAAPATPELFATSTPISFAASTSVPEPARRGKVGRSLLPVALIAAFLGGAALGAFVMYRSEISEPLGTVASQPASPPASREIDRTLGIGTTGPAATDSPAPRNSAATPATPADSTVPTTVAPSAATPGSVPDGPTGRPAAVPRPPDPAVSPPPRATAIPAPVETPAATPQPESRAGNGPSATPASDLSGDWTLNTVVESSSLSTYEGLRLGYRLQLEQRGNAVRGSGHKILENGNAIGGGGQTPITVEGTVDGDRLRLAFTERGAQRSSSGTFVLFREGTDGWRGRFASDAARSAGRVEALRR